MRMMTGPTLEVPFHQNAQAKLKKANLNLIAEYYVANFLPIHPKENTMLPFSEDPIQKEIIFSGKKSHFLELPLTAVVPLWKQLWLLRHQDLIVLTSFLQLGLHFPTGLICCFVRANQQLTLDAPCTSPLALRCNAKEGSHFRIV